MNIGMKMINEIKEKITDLENQINLKENEEKNLKEEKTSLDAKLSLLINDNKFSEDKKEEIEYKNNNIGKWKKKTIINTLLITLAYNLIAIILMLAFLGYFNPTGLLITNVFTLPYAAFIGQSNNYYSNKRFLKKNKLEDVEKEINNTNEKINSIKKKMSEIDIKLENIETIKDILNQEIKNAKVEITKIENMMMVTPNSNSLEDIEETIEKSKKYIKK